MSMRGTLVAPNWFQIIIEKLKLQHKHNAPELINHIAVNCGGPQSLAICVLTADPYATQ